MTDHDEGVRLAQGWIDDWNRHDLDAAPPDPIGGRG